MKPNYFIRHILIALLSWLALSVWLVSNTAVAAVEYQVLQSLGKQEGRPYGKLIQDSAGNFYGTTNQGGSNGAGTVFKIDSSGNVSVLHSFDGGNGGGYPQSGLIQGSDGNLYGTTYGGGSNDAGTVFKIDASGSFTVLHEFDGAKGGSRPYFADLVQASDGNFYGTTFFGGSNNSGTVFRIDSSGNFSVMHEFDGAGGGAYPYSGLIQSGDGSLFGTTYSGGSSAAGTVYKLELSGNFIVLHSFEGGSGGSSPVAPLVQGSDGSFYGTTFSGGSNFNGVVFKLDTSGNFSILHSFDTTLFPHAGLIQAEDGNFYGTTYAGGSSNYGTVFKVDASGNFSVLHEFDMTNDNGAYPYAGLIQGSDGNLYGTTNSAGSNWTGTIFKVGYSGNFSILYSFDANAHGTPRNGLIKGSDGNLYGTANNLDGYSLDRAAIFKYDIEGNFSILHEYGETDYVSPNSKLMQDNKGDFYGTSFSGGIYGYGMVFKLDSSGIYSVLYDFNVDSGGSSPNSSLIQSSDGSFYGTTYTGGANFYGVIFKLDSSGNYSVLHNFGLNEGTPSFSNLIRDSDGSFYGTTSFGGSLGGGIVFQIDPNDKFNVIYEFENDSSWSSVNSLVRDNNGNFYGTTSGFYDDTTGSGYGGDVFKLDPSGKFSILYTFDDTANGSRPTNSGLIQGSDGISLYGTTYDGGSNGYGVVYKIDSSGNFSVLHNFDASNDGGNPDSGLVQGNDGNFYGTTTLGGIYGGGTVFRLVETSDSPEPPDDTLSVAMSSSPNPSLRGQRVTFTATVTGNHPTGTVQFLDGSKKLGTMPLIDGVATVSTSRLKSGRHLITAVYSGDANNASFTSTPLVHGVKAVTKKELRARPRGTLGRGGR
jgi:uncharacterized repeat protein (TIGR03803 family)